MVERSRELRALMLAFYHDWSKGDDAFLDVLSESEHAVHIGTDPSEWWVGGVGAKALWRQQLDEVGRFQVEPGDLVTVVHEGTGWVVDNPKVIFKNGYVVDARITSVFVREDDGEWRSVHIHLSVGVANEDAVGMELTTSIERLADWAAEAKPDLTQSVSPEGTVTIAFTDLESSTELNEKLGDEAWLEFIRHHDDVVRETVESHGGSIVKGVGDGFMLAFPSARRSVECAISLQRRVTAVSMIPVRMRVGLHTGEPIRHRDDLFGRDVAYAARVGAVAEGGEILVSSVVRSLCTGATLDFEGPREVEFKGFDGKQPVYAVPWTDQPS
jgi:adenylate cyclase